MQVRLLEILMDVLVSNVPYENFWITLTTYYSMQVKQTLKETLYLE